MSNPKAPDDKNKPVNRHHAHTHDHGHSHDHDRKHDHSQAPISQFAPVVVAPTVQVDSGAHHHGHSHAHVRADGRERQLMGTLFLVCGYILVEAIGGWVAGSLALLADAGHMLSDAASLGLTLFAVRIAKRPPDHQHTYGFRRAEVLAATANASTLLVISVFILYEAYTRLGHPVVWEGPVVVGVAVGGLLVNLLSLKLLGGHHDHDLNLKAAWAHVLSDALGSVAAILAGLGAWYGGWNWVDPVASALIALLVLRSGWSLLKESVDVLMERAPPSVDVAKIREVLSAFHGVVSVHDLHVWSVGAGEVALSGHVIVQPDHAHPQTVREMGQVLREKFAISHSTIQLEHSGCEQVGLHP